MNIIKALKRNIINTKYLLVFFLLVILVYYSLAQELIDKIGLSQMFIRTASETSFLQSLLTRQYMIVLTLMGPLLTTVACSSLYTQDCKANMVNMILVRTSKLKYQLSNLISCIISSFLLVFGPLSLGYLIALITCPVKDAMDNMTATPTYLIEYVANDTLGLWERFNPLAFTFFHIIIISLVLALLAGLAYVLSLYFYWNQYISISIIFVAYLIYNISLSKFGLDKYTFFNLMDPYLDKPSLIIIILMLLILLVVVGLLFFVYIKIGDNNE